VSRLFVLCSEVHSGAGTRRHRERSSCKGVWAGCDKQNATKSRREKSEDTRRTRKMPERTKPKLAAHRLRRRLHADSAKLDRARLPQKQQQQLPSSASPNKLMSATVG
jgi:hypothetical protein